MTFSLLHLWRKIPSVFAFKVFEWNGKGKGWGTNHRTDILRSLGSPLSLPTGEVVGAGGSPQLDSLLLSVAVPLMNIGLLSLASSTLFLWGGLSTMNIIDM